MRSNRIQEKKNNKIQYIKVACQGQEEIGKPREWWMYKEE
jgi:hypothetical protein